MKVEYEYTFEDVENDLLGDLRELGSLPNNKLSLTQLANLVIEAKASNGLGVGTVLFKRSEGSGPDHKSL